MPQSVFTSQYAVLQKILTHARRRNGLTQKDVAQALGKPQSFVSKYERGERRLDLVEFLAVAKVLNLDTLSVVQQIAAADSDGTSEGNHASSI